MSSLKFRNIEVAPDCPLEEWPTEGIISALERGGLSDWGRIADAPLRSLGTRCATAEARGGVSWWGGRRVNTAGAGGQMALAKHELAGSRQQPTYAGREASRIRAAAHQRLRDAALPQRAAPRCCLTWLRE